MMEIGITVEGQEKNGELPYLLCFLGITMD